MPKPTCDLAGVSAFNHTGNFDGWLAVAASGKTYNAASSSTTAPSYYLSTCSREAFSMWVGVQSTAPALIQAGLLVDEYRSTLATGFYEFAGGPWDTTNAKVVHVSYTAGHRYFFKVQVLSDSRTHITVEDLDNAPNTFDSDVSLHSTGANSYKGPYGFFISERPEEYPNYPSLTNPVYAEFMNNSGARFRTTTVHVMPDNVDARANTQSDQWYQMYSPPSSSNLIGYPSALDSSSNFTAYWRGCGANDPFP